jgi:hypothetical protein
MSNGGDKTPRTDNDADPNFSSFLWDHLFLFSNAGSIQSVKSPGRFLFYLSHSRHILS